MTNKLIKEFTTRFIKDEPEKYNKLLSEFITIKLKKLLHEDLSLSNNVKLVGDDVFVDDKKVGTIRNDINNFDEGIIFINLAGKETEFNSLNALYEFVISKYAKNISPENNISI